MPDLTFYAAALRDFARGKKLRPSVYAALRADRYLTEKDGVDIITPLGTQLIRKYEGGPRGTSNC